MGLVLMTWPPRALPRAMPLSLNPTIGRYLSRESTYQPVIVLQYPGRVRVFPKTLTTVFHNNSWYGLMTSWESTLLAMRYYCYLVVRW